MTSPWDLAADWSSLGAIGGVSSTGTPETLVV